jgi:hypothetical protein
MRMQRYYAGSTEAVYFHGHGYSASANTKLQVRFYNNLGVLQVRAIIFDSIAEVSTDLGTGLSAANVIDHARILLRNSRTRDSLSPNHTINDGELEKVLSAGSFIHPRSLRTGSMVIENVMRLKRFFITNDGHLSIGPSRLRAGDLIAIIAGCSFPMILRSDGACFNLVGEAYSKIYVPLCLSFTNSMKSSQPYEWRDFGALSDWIIELD